MRTRFELVKDGIFIDFEKIEKGEKKEGFTVYSLISDRKLIAIIIGKEIKHVETKKYKEHQRVIFTCE